MFNETIVAISTARVNQPISIIRISGPNSVSILKSIFSGKIPGHKETSFGVIFDLKRQPLDEVIVSLYLNPNSYTGEDMVEINCHGGIVVTDLILNLILTFDVRMATRGEFTRKAFVNGKIDLIKADAIHDLIFSKTKNQAILSTQKMRKGTSKLIDSYIVQLLDLIAICETNIDYPEYDDVTNLTNKNILPILQELEKNILKIIENYEQFKFIETGFNVSIIGKPNVGKSTLLNKIINQEKAIVTNVPGTTRDVVEGELILDNFLLKFLDTAGIRKASGTIEKIGISKTISAIEKSNIVIHAIDIKKRNENLDHEFNSKIERLIKDKIYIKVFTKLDLDKNYKGETIAISAKNDSIDKLIDEIKKQIPNADLNDENLIVNSRQISLIRKTHNSITQAIQSIRQGHTPDTIIVDIYEAWESIASVNGKLRKEDLLDYLFSNFCLGK